MMHYTNEEENFFSEIDYFKNSVIWHIKILFFINIFCLPYMFYSFSYIQPLSLASPFQFFSTFSTYQLIVLSILLTADIGLPIMIYFKASKTFDSLRESFHDQIHAHRSVVCSSEINKAIKEIRDYREATSDINETAYDILKKLRELFNQSYELNDNLSSIISKQDDVETLHLEYKSCYDDLREIIRLLKTLSSDLSSTNIGDFIKFLELMETKQREEYNKVLNQLNKVADDNLEEIIGLIQNAKTTLKNDINLINQVSGMIDAQIKKTNTLNNSLERAMENARYFN